MTIVMDVFVGLVAIVSFAVFVMAAYWRLEHEHVPVRIYGYTLLVPAVFIALMLFQFHPIIIIKVTDLFTPLSSITSSDITSALMGGAIVVLVANLFARGRDNCEK